MRDVMRRLIGHACVAALVVVGLLIVGFGVRLAFTPKIPAEYASTTRATIGSFESSYQSKAGGRSIRIHYAVGGERYHESMPVLDDAWQVGDVLEIRYDTRNPRNKEWVNDRPVRRMIGGGFISAIGLALLAFVGWVLRQIGRSGAG